MAGVALLFFELTTFFSSAPLLALALWLLALIRLYKWQEWWWLLPLCILLMVFVRKWREWKGSVMVTSLLACYLIFRMATPAEPLHSEWDLSFNRIKLIEIEGRAPLWRYIGKATSKENLYQLPFSYTLPARMEQPDPTCSYLCNAMLVPPKKGTMWKLKRPPKSCWGCGQEGSQLPLIRYNLQKSFKSHMQQVFEGDNVRDLLTGMLLGESQNTVQTYQLTRLGLQHLLAVSGLHFSLLALFFGYLFSRGMPLRMASLIAWLLLSGYFFFLGPQPSVMRAWVMIGLSTLAVLCNRSSSPFNHLGAALIVCCIVDPWLTEHLGFQFSFLLTTAILLFVPLIEPKLKKIIPLKFLRVLIALALSVQLASMPMTLLINREWNAGMFFYNLFVPTWLGISLWLLVIGLSVGMLHTEAALVIHRINEWWTEPVLKWIAKPPRFLLEPLPLLINNPAWLYFFCLFAIGLHLHLCQKAAKRYGVPMMESVFGRFLC